MKKKTLVKNLVVRYILLYLIYHYVIHTSIPTKAFHHLCVFVISKLSHVTQERKTFVVLTRFYYFLNTDCVLRISQEGPAYI